LRLLGAVPPKILDQDGRDRSRYDPASSALSDRDRTNGVKSGCRVGGAGRAARRAMKIGLMLYLANDRQTNSKRPYAAIRAVAQQAEADGFDSIWLAAHLLYRSRRGHSSHSARERRRRSSMADPAKSKDKEQSARLRWWGILSLSCAGGLAIQHSDTALKLALGN
jgi:hypothetical protein